MSMQNFRLIVHMVVACIVLSGLSVKQEVKGLMTNYITMHSPGRKTVYGLICR